ncbi:MAG: type II secretion system inner membrane protein GspF [Deltaproteobacteria bacterium]|nr:type II secretion system inner membrane protein GspF [Deltaproteobacteria bacterium]
MAVYQWQGIDRRGKAIKGIRDADSVKALRLVLRKEGVIATAIEEETAARKRSAKEIDLKRFFQRVSTQEIAMTTRQLSTLLVAGVPLVEALSAVMEQLENPLLKTAFTQTRDKVNEGSSLADALKDHPKIFPDVYINMVAAGEASGTLDNVLERLAEFLDAQAELKNKVAGALIYPIILSGVMVLVITIIMLFVVPKVTAIYADFQQTLPWYTNLLIMTSDFMSGYWWLLLLLIIGARYALRRWKSTPEGRFKWDGKMLELPLFGPLFTMVAVARFARTLSTLLSSGVQVLTAMDITRNVLGNQVLMRVVEEAREAIREGESIALPLKRSGRFPPIVTHMIAIGERSGQLEQMLQHVANAYDNQVSMRVSTMTRILEPLMILLMAAVVLCIVMAMLIPLLQINEFVQ